MLFVSRRVGKQNLQEKTIELGFRQRVSSFVLNGILSSQHREHRRERIHLTVDGYLSFFHCLEQCGLRFGRSAIDFIRQQNVSEDWTATQIEARRAHVK